MVLQPTLAAGLMVRRAEPLNCETPLTSLVDGAVTANSKFYIRNHFRSQELDATRWRLRIGGLVGRQLSLTLAELRAMPSTSAVVTLECAGNGRSGLEPPVPGEQWGVGAVSTAEWTGVPLCHVLDQAGVLPAANEVVFGGSDVGLVEEHEQPVRFERSLPVGELMRTCPLLAYGMNGVELPASHGYPVRLVVPAWYAVASVKWLTRIWLVDQPFRGYFQAECYQINGEPLTLLPVRALITDPVPGERICVGTRAIRGVAWSGAAPIASVEVSVGRSPWQPAVLLDARRTGSWQRWETTYSFDRPGAVWVRARATDLAGRTQPERPSWNPLGYANNAIQKFKLAVTG